MKRIQDLTQEMRKLANSEMLADCLDDYLNLIDEIADRAVAFWDNGMIPDNEPVLVQLEKDEDSDDIIQATNYPGYALDLLVPPFYYSKPVRRWARINKVDK